MAPKKVTIPAPAATPKAAEPAPTPKPAPVPAPVVEEEVAAADNFAVVLETLDGFQKQLKTLIATVKTLKKENDKLKKQAARKGRGKKAAAEGGAPRAPSGFNKPSLLSDELCAFLGLAKGSSLSRAEVSSKVHEYIKANNLQNPEDRRQIVPDAKLNKVLAVGKGETLTYFHLQKYMKPHFTKAA